MALSHFDLSGKRALITGGTQGIGYTIAKGLGESEATVVINGRNEEKLTDCVESLWAAGIEAI